MKKILTILILYGIAFKSSAQYIDANATKPKSSFSDHLFFGGIFGLQFATDQTYVEVAPLIGYRVTEKFSAGLNLKYIFYKYHIDNFPTYSTSLYGGGPFARYFIFDGLFAHFEYELLNMEVPDLYGQLYRENVTSVFLGGGYRQMLGDRSALDFMILWNINDNKYSPYVNPIIQFGFAFGI
jgi:hypothetical protein